MVVGALRRKEVIVRPLGGRVPTQIRVSIKAPPENGRFIEALRAECCRMMSGHMRFPTKLCYNLPMKPGPRLRWANVMLGVNQRS